MIISDKYQFVYIDVPKTGSTTFDQFFSQKKFAGKTVPPENPNHKKHCRKIPTHAGNYTKVISVRNPYRRLQSLYYYHLHRLACKATKVSVDDFLHKIIKEKDEYQNSEFTMYLSMSEYLKPFEITTSDYVIKLENAKSDIARLPFVNGPVELPWRNASDVDASFELLPETIQKINHWAKDDFSQFGYSKTVRK